MIPDNRPGEREVWTYTVRYKRYIDRWPSALHVDYRYTSDGWECGSHTFEFQWKKKLDSCWIVGPGLRYYSQESAYFYYFNLNARSDAGRYVTSDYRLAGFGAVSAKFELSDDLTDNIQLQFNYEYYNRKRDYELTDTKGSILDDYSSEIFSVSIQSTF